MVLDPWILPWDFGKQFQRSSINGFETRRGPLCRVRGRPRPRVHQPTHTAIPGPPGATAARQPPAAQDSDASSPQGPGHLAQGGRGGRGEARQQSLPPTHPDTHPDPGMDASPRVSEPHWEVPPGGQAREGGVRPGTGAPGLSGRDSLHPDLWLPGRHSAWFPNDHVQQPVATSLGRRPEPWEKAARAAPPAPRRPVSPTGNAWAHDL